MSPEKERRGIRVKKRVELQYWSDSPPTEAHIEDISDSGMFIDTPQPLPKGIVLEFSFHLPGVDPEKPITGSAKVVWTDPTGMGVEFLELSDEDRERIHLFAAAVFFDQPPELLSG